MFATIPAHLNGVLITLSITLPTGATTFLIPISKKYNINYNILYHIICILSNIAREIYRRTALTILILKWKVLTSSKTIRLPNSVTNISVCRVIISKNIVTEPINFPSRKAKSWANIILYRSNPSFPHTKAILGSQALTV